MHANVGRLERWHELNPEGVYLTGKCVELPADGVETERRSDRLSDDGVRELLRRKLTDDGGWFEAFDPADYFGDDSHMGRYEELRHTDGPPTLLRSTTISYAPTVSIGEARPDETPDDPAEGDTGVLSNQNVVYRKGRWCYE